MLVAAGCAIPNGEPSADTGQSAEPDTAEQPDNATSPDDPPDEETPEEALEDDTTGDSASNDTPAEDTSADGTVDIEASAGPLNAIDAIGVAVGTTGGAVVELDLDDEQGRIVWEVEVLQEDGSGIELHIDLESAEVVREREVQLSSDQQTAPSLSAQEAVEEALHAVPGAVVEMDLDTEDSVLVWEVQVDADAGGRYELDLDATTGDVLKQEFDD